MQLASLPVLKTLDVLVISCSLNLVAVIRVVRFLYNLVGVRFLNNCGVGGLGTGLLAAREVL